MSDTPLNEEALDMRAYDEALLAFKKVAELHPGQAVALKDAVLAYMQATPAPAVVEAFTPQALNIKGWTCGCEPGNYDTCDECQTACDELSNFLNRGGEHA